MNIYQLVVIVTVMSVITAIGTSWLCFKAWRVSTTLTAAGDIASAAAEYSHDEFIAVLSRIETEMAASTATAERTSGKVDVATELGYQNAESNERIEDAAAHVAADLADSQRRADAMPIDAADGAAADAASRSEPPHPTEES